MKTETTVDGTCPAECTTHTMVRTRTTNGTETWECQSCLGYWSREQIITADRRMGYSPTLFTS